MNKYTFVPVDSFLYFFTLSLSSWFFSITTGLIYLNIVAQRFNYINLRGVAGCCIFEISNNNLKKTKL